MRLGPTWTAAKLTTNMRVVKDSTVSSGPSASSIDHDRKSFYQKPNDECLSPPRADLTNRFVGPLISILAQVFSSLFNYWTNKLHSTLFALMDARK